VVSALASSLYSGNNICSTIEPAHSLNWTIALFLDDLILCIGVSRMETLLTGGERTTEARKDILDNTANFLAPPFKI